MLREFSEKTKEIKISEKAVYRIIYQYGPVTKTEIANQLDSSLTTVSRFIDTLSDKKLISEINKKEISGRKAFKYIIDPNSGFAFGAFITSDLYGISICSIGGEIIDSVEFPLTQDVKPHDVADTFASYINETSQKYIDNKNSIMGCGIAAMGPIIKSKGIIFHPYHFKSPDWNFVSIKDLIEFKTGVDTWVDNITQTALLSEIIYGNYKDLSSAAYISMDRGIGCAIYSQGILGLGSGDTNISNIGHKIGRAHV